VERALRGVAVGRENHYGSRSERGTRVTALICSLIESAKLAGVGLRAYLQGATLQAVRNPGTATPATWGRNSPDSGPLGTPGITSRGPSEKRPPITAASNRAATAAARMAVILAIRRIRSTLQRGSGLSSFYEPEEG
jgi:hypothetical protein